MSKVILAIVTTLFITCSSNPVEKIVPISEAKKDGFEVIILQDNKFKMIRYNEIQKESNLSSYLIPLNKIKTLSKNIEKDNNITQCFVTSKIDILSNKSQHICIEFHYSKSTYEYCYKVTEKKIIPKNSTYFDVSENILTMYRSKNAKPTVHL